MKDKIELAISLDNKFWQLKLILADNIIELLLLDIIQNEASDDWYKGESKPQPSERLTLFYNFPKKVEYANAKGFITSEEKAVIDILHKYRNVAYHVDFSHILGDTVISGRDEEDYIEYRKQKKSIRRKIAEYYLVIALEIVLRLKPALGKTLEINTYLNSREGFREKFSLELSRGLDFRIQKLKDDLVFCARHDRKFQESELKIEDLGQVIDHILANYGRPVIEKSSLLDPKTKKYYLKLYSNGSGIYVEPDSLEEGKKLITPEKIKEWEDLAGQINSERPLRVVLTKWHRINKKLAPFEEMVDLYISTAC